VETAAATRAATAEVTRVVSKAATAEATPAVSKSDLPRTRADSPAPSKADPSSLLRAVRARAMPRSCRPLMGRAMRRSKGIRTRTRVVSRGVGIIGRGGRIMVGIGRVGVTRADGEAVVVVVMEVAEAVAVAMVVDTKSESQEFESDCWE